MPYRRLPNTDQARLRALKRALDKGRTVSPVDLAFSQAGLQKVKYFLPLFEQTMIQQQQAFSTQVTRSKDYIDLYRKAKLYISHFIQVVNMAVQRGELPAEMKLYYGLSERSKKVPALNTEADVLKWGERVIKGESERLAKGGNPVTNPTMALLRVRYEKFLDAYRKQKTLQEINNRALNKVSDLRSEADEIILNIWNEIEDHFRNLGSRERREKAMAYGLVYVYRKGEKASLEGEEDEDSENSTMSLQEAKQLEREKAQYSFFFEEQKVNQTADQD